MADVRVQSAIKIVDPTTNTQEAGVDANGDLQVVIANGVVPGVGATNLGKAEDAARVSGDTGVMALAIRDDVLIAGAEVSADLDYLPLRTDNFGALWSALTADDGTRLPANSTNGLVVNLATNNDVTTELVGSTPVATMADADINPDVLPIGAYQMGFNGTTWDRIRTANTGRLQVDVVTGGGAPGAPTGPTIDNKTSAALAAGGSVNVDSNELTEKENLSKATFTSSVPFKVSIASVENTVETIHAVMFGRAGETVSFDPPDRRYVSASNTAGTDVFRAKFVNHDTSEAADVYASFFYQSD